MKKVRNALLAAGLLGGGAFYAFFEDTYEKCPQAGIIAETAMTAIVFGAECQGFPYIVDAVDTVMDDLDYCGERDIDEERLPSGEWSDLSAACFNVRDRLKDLVGSRIPEEWRCKRSLLKRGTFAMTCRALNDIGRGQSF